MAETKIEWTSRIHPTTKTKHPGFTYNPWIGCTKVSPGCLHCYAETLDNRRFSKTLGGASPEAPQSHWGPGAPRHPTKTAPNLLKWHKAAALAGIPLAVFMASLSDWLDDAVPLEWFIQAVAQMQFCQNLDFLTVTKRPENFFPRMEAALVEVATNDPKNPLVDWLSRWIEGGIPPQNVWVGVTYENQYAWGSRSEHHRKIPAVVKFGSFEPLLSAIDFVGCNCGEKGCGEKIFLDWIIAGGESCEDDKELSRPCHPDWFHGLAVAAWGQDIPFFFKQWGDWCPAYDIADAQAKAMAVMGNVKMYEFATGEGGRRQVFCVGKAAAGRLLDGKLSEGMPPLRRL